MNDNKDLLKVIKVTEKMGKRRGTDAVLIPVPIEIDQIIIKFKNGKLIVNNEILSFLVKKHKATMSCPITTEIFTWFAGHTTEESELLEKRNIFYRRTLKTNRELNKNYNI